MCERSLHEANTALFSPSSPNYEAAALTSDEELAGYRAAFQDAQIGPAKWNTAGTFPRAYCMPKYKMVRPDVKLGTRPPRPPQRCKIRIQPASVSQPSVKPPAHAFQALLRLDVGQWYIPGPCSQAWMERAVQKTCKRWACCTRLVGVRHSAPYRNRTPRDMSPPPPSTFCRYLRSQHSAAHLQVRGNGLYQQSGGCNSVSTKNDDDGQPPNIRTENGRRSHQESPRTEDDSVH